MVLHGLTEGEDGVWRVSFQMLEALRTAIEQQLQASSGLSNADYTVLALLAEAPERRMRPYELGRAAGWEKSRLHHQLTRMSKRCLVVRERCGPRGMEAVITEKGLTVLRQAVPGHAQEVRRLFIDRLTPQELEQFARIATTVLEGMSDAQEPGSPPT